MTVMDRHPRTTHNTPPGIWWSREALRLHLTLVIALPGCLAAGWFELTRALAGHELAWAYAFEWPLFGVLGTYVWWKLVHAEPLGNPSVPNPHGSPRAVTPAAAVDPEALIDPELQAWQRYLDQLHEKDPPGKPPWQQ